MGKKIFPIVVVIAIILVMVTGPNSPLDLLNLIDRWYVRP